MTTPTPAEPPVIGPPVDLQVGPHAPMRAELPQLPEQPRLGIIHIMLWTAGCAVLLGAQQALMDWEEPDWSMERRIFVQGLWVVYAIVYGTGIGGLGIFVARRIRGIPYPIHPGHWILLAMGILTALGFVSWAIIELLVPRDAHEIRQHLQFLFEATSNVVGATIFCFPAWRLREGTRWTFYFAAEIVIYGLAFHLCWMHCFHFIFWPSYWDARMAFNVIGLIILCLSVILDFRVRRRREWLHYTGVAVVAVAMVLHLVDWAAWQFYFSYR